MTSSTPAAFDPATRAWLPELKPGAIPVPELDGVLTVEPAALAEAARDFGALVEHAPLAVLRPAHARDVAAAIGLARRCRLPVAARGQAHSSFGQAQSPGGIVIDARSLKTIDPVQNNSIWADAGVTWRELVMLTAAEGFTPPVLTDYLDLSIGGVLSVGGIGGAAHRFGFVADHCVELEVVTGQAEIVRCSATHNQQLFRAVLGGLGQCAIIARARISLHAAKPLARVYQLAYTDLTAFLRDQRLSCDDERFDFLQGLAMFTPNGTLGFIVQGARWYAPDAPPDNASALAGLAPASTEIIDLPYTAWAARVDANVAQWQAVGAWNAQHPWCDLFLPDDAVDAFAARALAELTPADLGAGLVLLYAFKRGPTTPPAISLPSSGRLWLLDLLRFVGPGTKDAATMLADNRALYDRALSVGATRYAISAMPFGPEDQQAHFDAFWPELRAAKLAFDPDRILTPNQRIFEFSRAPIE